MNTREIYEKFKDDKVLSDEELYHLVCYLRLLHGMLFLGLRFDFLRQAITNDLIVLEGYQRARKENE